ncbi:MAG: ATP-dependent Clp protease ATP-binding subunit [Alphaproteobacteria bacterium]|nr:ATP-dependent Clp protease ATP-binding subunit [Alphaproteobacteria bacterium]
MSTQWSYAVTNEELEELFRLYCTDFTTLAKQGRYGPITGRDKEVEETILILLQKGRKNAVLLAPAGVGKTAMVVALAQRIANDEVPDYLRDARLIEVELARMAAGTSGPAEFQERFIPLCKGIAERYHNPENPRIILFLDEIHQIMPGCVGSSYAGLSDVMKPYMTAGDLMVIGATTLDEFRTYVAEDPAMERRFQKVFLSIPNTVETYSILKSLRPSHEKHHGVTISNNNLMTIVQLTDEHMRKRNQPDKSIITLDSAMAYHVKMHGKGTEVSLESIYYMIGRETGLNKQALHDEKKIQRIIKQVREIEGEGYMYFI